MNGKAVGGSTKLVIKVKPRVQPVVRACFLGLSVIYDGDPDAPDRDVELLVGQPRWLLALVIENVMIIKGTFTHRIEVILIWDETVETYMLFDLIRRGYLGGEPPRPRR